MKISEKLAGAINDQINYELYSGYIYLSMTAWFEGQNLTGMARWMKVQAGEEYKHAMKFWDYVVTGWRGPPQGRRGTEVRVGLTP